MSCFLHEPYFTYTGCDGKECAVDLQMFCRNDNRIVAVVSELLAEGREPMMPSPRVCNDIERIATQLARRKLDFDFLIEHYPVHGRYAGWHREGSTLETIPETFDLVPLVWDAAAKAFRILNAPVSWTWNHIDRATAEAIIGEPLELSYVDVN